MKFFLLVAALSSAVLFSGCDDSLLEESKVEGIEVMEQSLASNKVMVLCESHDYLSEFCSVSRGIVSVELVEEVSEASCDNNWQSTGGSISVYDGCRALFEVTLISTVEVVTRQCNSLDYEQAECAVPISIFHNVWIQSRESDNGCKRGRDWDTFWGVLWVDRGCRATFASAQQVPTRVKEVGVSGGFQSLR